jgi:hypothetical protein
MGEHMDDKKKITAAISAVINYIQEEEAAICMESAMAPNPAITPLTPAQTSLRSALPSLWGTSGRQSQMQLRNLMQLRAFNRI